MIRKALITGASSGIGQAIALRLAREGIHVWIHYLSGRERALETAARIQQQGGHADIIAFDTGDWEQCRGQLESLLERESAFDIVVHNAGITDDAPFPGMEEKQWKQVINTDLNGFFHVIRPLVMPMIRKRWGRIVTTSSVAALHGNRGQTNYAAAKAGLIGASRSLAKELASRGICVNVVAPGFIDTPMTKGIPEDLIRDMVPMQRVGKVEEVAEVVAFLCSDAASYITGDVLNVSGGII